MAAVEGYPFATVATVTPTIAGSRSWRARPA